MGDTLFLPLRKIKAKVITSRYWIFVALFTSFLHIQNNMDYNYIILHQYQNIECNIFNQKLELTTKTAK